MIINGDRESVAIYLQNIWNQWQLAKSHRKYIAPVFEPDNEI